MTRLYIIGAGTVILLGILWVYVLSYGRAEYRRGVADTEAAQIIATQEILTKAEAMASKSRKDIAELRAKYERITNAERDKIRELMQINTELAEWWLQNVPSDAIGFVFSGVPSADDKGRGSVPDADGDSVIGYTKQAGITLH